MLEGSKDKDGKEITKDHPWYGGAGYAGKGAKSPDMSNTSYFLDALIETGVSKDDPAVKAALVYATRNQGLGETNDQPWAKGVTHGGFIYSTSTPGRESMFGNTERDGQTVLVEYGSMTYAGLKSFIYAGLTKDDVRVKAAIKWIGGHWTLEENPGTGKETGLYYFYHTFAKALKTYGEDRITDSKGVAHDWREDLAAALKKRQKDDGSFVNEKEARWMEGNPLLATSYAVLAMQEARK
jgi:squalene-hopene/tetraprenyl-beta-curcumene cyclase